MNSKYDSIVDLPHHVSATRPQMTMIDRAAQFAPFAALSGYGSAVAETARLTDKRIELDENMQAELSNTLNELLRNIDERPDVTITYFVPDKRKAGGAYVSFTGNIKKIDEFERVIIMEDGTKIPIDDITDIIRTQDK